MVYRSTHTLVKSFAFVLILTCPSLAQEPQQTPHDNPAMRTGIVTDGMSRGHLRTWKSIVNIVMAKDKRGCYLHPTLHALYHQADTSGHLIRIELTEALSLSRAGLFSIDDLDPEGIRHVTTIRLNLATIRRTYVGEDARRADGLLPFEGFGTKERYAEVLGHELAHAVGILLDQDYLQLYLDLEKEVEEYYSLLKNTASRPDELETRLKMIETMQAAFEKPARTAEREIWRELKNAGRNSSK